MNLSQRLRSLGWVIGWHAGTGELVTKYAMEGGKETNGIGGGIWMSGGGLASDNPGRMFFATVCFSPFIGHRILTSYRK
jgi:hypothetical protein